MLFMLPLAVGVSLAAYRWWYTAYSLGAARVRACDRAVITEIVGLPRIVVVTTDRKEVKSLAKGLAACIRDEQDRLCVPPLYKIELFRGERKVISAEPTPCCRVFEVDGRRYRDTWRKLERAVDRIIRSHAHTSDK